MVHAQLCQVKSVFCTCHAFPAGESHQFAAANGMQLRMAGLQLAGDSKQY